MKKHSKLLLWGIFLLLVSIYIRVLDINYILPGYLDVLSWLLFVAALLFAGAALFMDFIDDNDKKPDGQ